MNKMAFAKYVFVSILLPCLLCVESWNRVNFVRADLRKSRFDDVRSTSYCVLREECITSCLQYQGCHSVRLFPLEKGFFSEYLPEDAHTDRTNYVYEDLNGE